MIEGTTYRVTAKTEAEARRQLRELVVNARNGTLPAPDKLTVKQHLWHWLEKVVKVNLRPATCRDYSNTVYNHAIPAFGNVKLARLQPGNLDDLYATMRRYGVSAKTIRNVHGTIHVALEHALKRGLVARNVADVVELPKYERPEITPFTEEEVRRLRVAIAGDRWEALITLAIVTGMRQSELLGLKWSDITLDTRRVSVNRQLDRGGVLSPTKTAKGRRVVDLPAFAVEALRAHRIRQKELRLKVGSAWEQRTMYKNLVFTTHVGGPLMHRNVFRA